jgi:uncharacterized protein with HEPN domain
MSKRRDREYLGDIHEAMHRISRYTSGLTFEQFLKDAKTQDAVVRNLEVIGEATKKLTSHLRKSVRHVPWKDLAGVRDKLIHHYFGINYEIVWTIARKELPGLLPNIKELIDKDDKTQIK